MLNHVVPPNASPKPEQRRRTLVRAYVAVNCRKTAQCGFPFFLQPTPPRNRRIRLIIPSSGRYDTFLMSPFCFKISVNQTHDQHISSRFLLPSAGWTDGGTDARTDGRAEMFPNALLIV